MRSMNQLGNDLYTGKTSFPFIARRRVWFIIAAVLVIGEALMDITDSAEIARELKECSEDIAAVDRRMQDIHRRIQNE